MHRFADSSFGDSSDFWLRVALTVNLEFRGFRVRCACQVAPRLYRHALKNLYTHLIRHRLSRAKGTFWWYSQSGTLLGTSEEVNSPDRVPAGPERRPHRQESGCSSQRQ